MPQLRNPLVVAAIVACAFFMETLNSTVIVTALPRMAVAFDTSPVRLSLGLTAYIITLAIMIPASGWIADRLGTRNVFCAAIGVFTLASICAASAIRSPSSSWRASCKASAAR